MGASIEQNLDRGRVTFTGSFHQGGPAHGILGIDLGADIQQKLYRAGVSPTGRLRQDGDLISCLGVGVSTGVD